MDPQSEHAIYEFEGFRLDTRRRELTAQGRDQAIHLKPRQYETLLFFVEHAGQLVGREALMQALWPDTVVEENNLNQHITALRQLLGEERGGRRFVMNVRGRGYQFVPDVMRLDRKGAAPTGNPAAWQCFQQALFLAGMDDPAQWMAAMDRLSQAVSLDGRFASALALLAQLRIRMVTIDWPDSGGLIDRAESEAKQALGLRPDLAFVHMAAGSVAAARGNWALGEERFRVAETLDEEWPVVRALHIAHVLLSTGHLRRATAMLRESQVRAHGMIGIVSIDALTHLFAGNESEARESLNLIMAMGGRPTQPLLTDLFALQAMREGRHVDAIALLQENLPERMRTAGVESAIARVVTSIATGVGTPHAVDQLDRLLERLPIADISDSIRHHLLVWYVQLGALDRAYAIGNYLLDYYSGQGTAGIFWGNLWRHESREFRRDSRFEAFATRIGLGDYWQRFGPPDAA
jgi:DNA-binding winged helix-turn-helix (wHTH) protein